LELRRWVDDRGDYRPSGIWFAAKPLRELF